MLDNSLITTVLQTQNNIIVHFSHAQKDKYSENCKTSSDIMMSNHWQHESHQAKDEGQGPFKVGHAVHDADVAAGQDSVRGASPLDEGGEVEKPFEHGYGIIGRAGRDHAVGSKISRRGIGAPLSSGSGFGTS